MAKKYQDRARKRSAYRRTADRWMYTQRPFLSGGYNIIPHTFFKCREITMSQEYQVQVGISFSFQYLSWTKMLDQSTYLLGPLNTLLAFTLQI